MRKSLSSSSVSMWSLTGSSRGNLYNGVGPHREEQGRSQEFVHGGANSKVEINDEEYHYCMDSLYF